MIDFHRTVDHRTFTGRTVPSGEIVEQNQQSFHRTATSPDADCRPVKNMNNINDDFTGRFSPPTGVVTARPVIPHGEALRRLALVPLCACKDCRHHAGVECTKTLDASWDEAMSCWVKIGKDDSHYCLEFKPQTTGPALVRCADCQAIRYHSGPPESLSCDHNLTVTAQSVNAATRCCALFVTRHQEARP